MAKEEYGFDCRLITTNMLKVNATRIEDFLQRFLEKDCNKQLGIQLHKHTAKDSKQDEDGWDPNKFLGKVFLTFARLAGSTRGRSAPAVRPWRRVHLAQKQEDDCRSLGLELLVFDDHDVSSY